MIYAVEFIGVKEGCSNPEHIREEIRSEIASRIRMEKLACKATKAGKYIAFKLCLNNANGLRWRTPILYIDSMKKSIPTIIQQRKPVNLEASTFSIHFVRVCEGVVERCQTNLESDLLATEIHLAMERESETNSHLDAFAVVVVQNNTPLRLQHVHYKGLKLLRKTIPNEKLGDYSWGELKRAKKWLFR